MSEEQEYWDDSKDDLVSKTRRKKEMLALQELGEKLTEAAPSLLEKCQLPDELLHAINEYKRIPKRRGARKRQLQYIGRVMRDVDVTKIRLVLDEDGQQALKENMRFQRLEKIRERLLEGDQLMLDELIGKIPDLDIQYIRQLVRQAARESSNSKPPASSRKLFSYLKELANI